METPGTYEMLSDCHKHWNVTVLLSEKWNFSNCWWFKCTLFDYTTWFLNKVFVVCQIDKKMPGKSKDEQMAEKKQELEKRLLDVNDKIGNTKKANKKGAYFLTLIWFPNNFSLL